MLFCLFDLLADQIISDSRQDCLTNTKSWVRSFNFEKMNINKKMALKSILKKRWLLWALNVTYKLLYLLIDDLILLYVDIQQNIPLCSETNSNIENTLNKAQVLRDKFEYWNL